MAEPVRLADGTYRVDDVPTTVPTSALSPEQYQQLLASGWQQSGNALVAPKVQASDPNSQQFDPRPSESSLLQQGYVKNSDGTFSRPFNAVNYYNDKGALPLPGDKDTGGAMPGMKPLPPGGMPNPYDPAFTPPSGVPDSYAPMPPGLGPNGYIAEDLSAPPDKMPGSTSAPPSTSPLAGYGSPAGPSSAAPPSTNPVNATGGPSAVGDGMMRIGDMILSAAEYASWMRSGGMTPSSSGSGPHPSSTDPKERGGDGTIGPALPPGNSGNGYGIDLNGDGMPDGVPPGLTGLPPSTPTATQPASAGPADSLPSNPGVDTTDANNNGTWDILEQGPGSPGYTPSKPPAPLVDRDGNGIDDREQTTVGGTGPFGPNYADMWASVLGSTPQLGWNSAIQTGVGAPVDAGGLGGGGGGGYSSPLGGYGTSTDTGGGFQMPNYTPPALPDVSQIGASSGTGTPSTGGTGGGFQFPEFQNPLTTGAGSGTSTTTGGTTPLAGYGSTPTTGGTTPNSALVQNLAGSYQQQIDAANASNMSRYDQGLNALLDRMDRAGFAINNMTQERLRDIGRSYDAQRARSDQDLIDRGLANTTVREGVIRGLQTNQTQDVNRYMDDQLRQNLNEDFRQTGSIVDWIGGRNDVAPSTGDLANLASGVGSAGPGAAATTTTGSSTTPPAVNLPPQVTTALQNGTLGSLAATQPGVNPAGTTTGGNSFLNQGANLTTPEQLSAAVNGGGTTRSQTAAPPPPAAATSPLAGYGSKADAKALEQWSQLGANAAGQLSRATNPGGSTAQFDTGVMMGPQPGNKYLSTGGDAALFADAETTPRAPTETKQFGQYAVPVSKPATQGGTLPTQQPIMGGGNANNGKTGMDAQYAPGMMGGGGNSFSAAPPPSMPKPPPPSSPSVMGFPDPQGTGMAPGNPNDVRESMRAQNPNNSQLQTLMSGADSWMKGYGQTDPGYRGGDSGMSQNTPVTPQAMPSAPPSMSNLGVVPQRPEPVPFNNATPQVSPLAGYGSMPQKPPMVAPPGMPPAPTFQQMGVPGPQYKPPSLVGGVTMPQPPARRWGV